MITKTNKKQHYINTALHYKGEAKMHRCDAAVHVEAEADVAFWNNIFMRYLPQKRLYFIAYSRTESNKIATGCTTCLKYKNLGCLSKEFFVCIDSDYRYLLEEKDICIENFLFQTYTYSIENHWCYSQKINIAFEKAGLKNTIFDFNLFLRHYSEVLYKLFLYHLHSVSVQDNYFPKKEFVKYLAIPCIDINPEAMIDSIRRNISLKLNELKKYYPNLNVDELKRKYAGLGVKKENTYLYFRGHNIFEQVILKIVRLVQKKIHKLQQPPNLSGKEKGNYYFKDFQKIYTHFHEDLFFGKYDAINKIEKDIKKFTNIL